LRGLLQGIFGAWENGVAAALTVLSTIYGVGYFLIVRAVELPVGITYLLLFRRFGLSDFIVRNSIVTAFVSSMFMIISYVVMGRGWTAGEWPHLLVAVPVYLVCITAFVVAAQSMSHMPAGLDEIEREIGRRWPEKWFSTRLRKSCDAYFVRFVLDSAVRVLPSTFLLFFVDFRFVDSVFAVGFYLLSQAMSADCVEIVDHTDIHNSVFRCRRDRTTSDKAIVWIMRNCWTYVLAPLCLRVPHFYRVQHLYVHHVENNGLSDNGSTLPYDRASFVDFCKLAFKLGISLSSAVDVSLYLLRRNKRRPFRQLWVGMLLWYGGLALVAIVHWEAAIIMIGTRFLGGGISAARTAFSWHGLIDMDEPENIYKNTTNAYLADGHGAFGSALHVEHHINPGSHWSDLQMRARANENQHVAFEAVELWGFGWFGNYFLAAVWMKRFDLIASYCVRIGSYGAEPGDLAATIERRTRPWGGHGRRGFARRIDEIMGRFVAGYLIGALRGTSEQQLAQIHREVASREVMVRSRVAHRG